MWGEKTFLMGAGQPTGPAGVINASPFWSTPQPSAPSLQLWLYPHTDLQDKTVTDMRYFTKASLAVLLSELSLSEYIRARVISNISLTACLGSKDVYNLG